jgi:hypothetical protein
MVCGRGDPGAINGRRERQVEWLVPALGWLYRWLSGHWLEIAIGIGILDLGWRLTSLEVQLKAIGIQVYTSGRRIEAKIEGDRTWPDAAQDPEDGRRMP